jgi:integrase
MMGRTRKRNKHLPRNMVMNHGAYYHLSYSGKKKVWTHLGRSYQDALVKYAAIEGRPQKARTIDEMLSAYLQNAAGRLAEKTMTEYARCAVKLNDWIKGVRIEDLTSDDVKDYLLRRGSKSAANAEIALLSAAYTEAVGKARNPCMGVRRNPRKKGTRYVTPAERKALMVAASPQIASMVELSYLTAARLSEILSIRLSDVTDEGLYITRGKNHDRMLFGASAELQEALGRAKAARRAKVGTLYLFANRKGQRYTVDGFEAMWRRVRVKAGLPGVRFHDLRRTRITDLKASHGIDVANALAGHQSVQTTERYVVGTGMRIVTLPIVGTGSVSRQGDSEDGA